MSEAALADLIAKQAITEVLYRYCRGLDRMDREMALSCWHEGGTAHYLGMFQGTGVGFVDWVWEAHAEMERHSHQVTNPLIEVDGDHAVSESYVTVGLWTRPAPQRFQITSRGRYLDRLSCRDGVWAIEHRVHIHDLTSRIELPEDALEQVNSASRRDPKDPSFEILSSLRSDGASASD
ncbi:nuclear transport factor 2 family protein [Myxococcota bacterium]|nr:nuclear transport factor 2 family protein [Myxococcota bacterium]